MPLNEWLEQVLDAFYCARHAWELDAEAVTFGYATEMAEYEALHPRPRLKDFLIELSHGQPETREAG